MITTTINTIKLNGLERDSRIINKGMVQYKGYSIQKYSYFSHEVFHVYKSGDFIAELMQQDENNSVFNDLAYTYIDSLRGNKKLLVA